MNSAQIKKIQRETVKKTLQLLEKKNLLKKINEGSFAGKATSSNPVQQTYLKFLADYFDKNTDDLYDYANAVAALRKIAKVIEQEGANFAKDDNEDFSEYVVAAMSNWKNGKQDGFNRTKNDWEA